MIKGLLSNLVFPLHHIGSSCPNGSGIMRMASGQVFKVTVIVITVAVACAAVLLCAFKYARKSDVPKEFKALVCKVNTLKAFHTFDMSTIYRNYTSARQIVIGSNTKGDKIFIKQPIGKTACISQPYAKQEQLSFMISHRLNLGVVPVTMACEGYQSIWHRSSTLIKAQLGVHEGSKGVVVQEGVVLFPNQFHMHQDRLKKSSEEGTRVIAELALDIDQICKALLFNIIVGRRDAGRRNSVIDQFKNIQEVDNENIGNTKTDSWLFESFAECSVSQKVIDDLLKIEDGVFENIFKDLACFPKTLFWNENTCEFDVVDRTQETIINNFKKLKAILLSNQHQDVRVKDLKTGCYRPGID